MDGAIDVLTELLLHGLIATLVVESFVHWLPVESPAARFPYRTSALAVPVLLAPLLWWIAPFRHDDWFRDLSVFVSARWELLQVGGADVRSIGLVVAAALGATLLGRDVMHVALDAWRVRRDESRIARVEPPPSLSARVHELAEQLAIPAPGLELLDAPRHTLHCRGWRRPRLIMSTGTLAALPDKELRAALAHELAHIAHHDVFRGWVLLALRCVQWFNPVAQAVGRRAAQELEWRADDRAAAVTGVPLALAHALVRSARRRGDQFLGLSGHGRFRTLEERCRRLMHGGLPPDGPWRTEILVLWGSLVVLLVFVQ